MFNLYDGTNLFNSQMPLPAHSLGPLPEVKACTVERDSDGLFDLTLTAPRESYNGDKLARGVWILAPVGGLLKRQYFCVDDVELTVNKDVKVHASHSSYNARDIVAYPFTSETGNTGAVDAAAWHSTLINAVDLIDRDQRGGFSIEYPRAYLNAAKYTEPVSVWQAIHDATADRDLMILGDSFKVKVEKPDDGAAPSFTIRYGKDLLDYSGKDTWDDFYTYIFPYAIPGSGKLNTYNKQIFQLKGVPEKYAHIKKVRKVDLSREYGLETEQGDITLDVLKIVIGMWLMDHPFSEPPREISLQAVQEEEGNVYELGKCGNVYGPDGELHRVTITSLKYDAVKDQITDIGTGRVRGTISGAVAKLEGKG